MPLALSQIADVVSGTLRSLGRAKFQQIAQKLVYYEIFSQWFKKNKVIFDGGYGVQRTLMTKLASSAKHVGIDETDEVIIKDLLTQMTVDYRHVQAHWSFLYQELLANTGDALVLNIIEPRRAGALIDMAADIEAKAWASPDVGNTTEPYGIPYWLPRGTGTPSFQNTLPSGHTTVGGVNPAVHTNFRHWNGAYVAVTKQDLIKKLRTAQRRCGFRSPISIPDYRGVIGDRYRLYCNETTISDLEDLGEGQNENLGRDLDTYGGQMLFHRNPIIYVETLNDDTNDPVYGIDHSVFYVICLKGDYLRESEPIQINNNHNGFAVFYDTSYNFMNVDRRRCWNLSK